MADVRREIELVLKARNEMSKNLSDATKSVGSMEKAVGGLQRLLAGAGIAVGLRAIAGQYRVIVDEVSRFADLSQRLGVSASALSSVSVAAKSSGVEIEVLAQGMRFLSIAISSGDKTLSTLMGGLEKLKAMRPEDALAAVVDAVKAIPDQNDRMRAAVEIFGRGGASVLQLSGNFSDLVKQAKTLGLVFGDNLVSGIDETGDSIDMLTQRIKVLKAEAAGKIGLGRIIDQMIAGLAPKESAAAAWRAYNTKYGVGTVGVDRDFAGGSGYQSATPGMGYTGQGAPLFPGMRQKLTFPSDAKPSEKEDGSVWWEDLPDATKLIAEAWEKAKDQEEMLRAGAEQHGEQIDEMLRAMEDTAQAQADAADEAKRMRDELTRAGVEAVDGMVSGVLQLASATGSATQRWAQGLAKVQAIYRSILAIAQAIAALRIIGAAMSGGASTVALAAGGTVRGAAGFRVTGGAPGRDSVRALLMPDETVISRDMTRQLARFLGRADAGYISPFALAGAGAGGGGNVTLQVARPIGRLDGLDLGSAAHAAQREFRRRFVE